MRKTARIDAISHGTAAMGAEEAYYWYARCAAPEEGRRARRALRILLADE
jgi:hypothetical protein